MGGKGDLEQFNTQNDTGLPFKEAGDIFIYSKNTANKNYFPYIQENYFTS